MKDGKYNGFDIRDILKHFTKGEVLDNGNSTVHRTINPAKLGDISGKVVISHQLITEEGSTVKEQIKALLEQIKGLKNPPKKILVPIQLGQGQAAHWVGLYIEPNLKDGTRPKIGYINSFGDQYKNRIVPNTVREVFGSTIPIAETRIRIQPAGDIESCGPLTADLLGRAANKDGIKFITSEEYAQLFLTEETANEAIADIRLKQARHVHKGSMPDFTASSDGIKTEKVLDSSRSSPPAHEQAPYQKAGGGNPEGLGNGIPKRGGNPMHDPLIDGPLVEKGGRKLPWGKITAITAGLGAVIIGGALLYQWNQEQQQKTAQNGPAARGRAA